jgi:hypothetical protein
MATLRMFEVTTDRFNLDEICMHTYPVIRSSQKEDKHNIRPNNRFYLLLFQLPVTHLQLQAIKNYD